MTPRSVGAIGYYFILMCVTPLLGGLEALVRGRVSVLYIKDIFLEVLVSASLFIFLVVKENSYIFSVFLISLFVFGGGILVGMLRPNFDVYEKIFQLPAVYLARGVNVLWQKVGWLTIFWLRSKQAKGWVSVWVGSRPA